MKKMIFSAVAIAAIAMVGCTANEEKKAEEQAATENADETQAYQVDVEASEVKTVETANGPVQEVENEVQLTPEQVTE